MARQVDVDEVILTPALRKACCTCALKRMERHCRLQERLSVREALPIVRLRVRLRPVRHRTLHRRVSARRTVLARKARTLVDIDVAVAAQSIRLRALHHSALRLELRDEVVLAHTVHKP